MRFFLALILGVAIGGAVVWYYSGHRDGDPPEAPTNSVGGTVKSAGASLEEKLQHLRLGTNDVKDELARTGQVVRDKARAAGQAIAQAVPDARITATIKGKLVADPNLSALTISVSTTDGVVTLSGQVSSPEDIGKAMMLALDTDGVHQVISTLQMKQPANQK